MNVFLWCFIEIFGVATLCCRPFCKTMIVTVVVTRRRLIQLELMHVCFHVKLFYCFGSLPAEPVVRGELKHLPEGSVFIYCQVGGRP